MEFSCLKEDLTKAVQIVEKAVGTKSSLPIIGNILIETHENGLKLASNNLEIGIEVIIPATVIQEGKILAPSKTLGSIVAKLPDTTINFEVFENQIIKIKCGQSKFNIHGLPADEFILVNHLSSDDGLSMSASTLKDMIKQVSFSVSGDESKQVLNGVYFQFGYDTDGLDKFRMVATDGYRLALKTGLLDKGVNKPLSFIVPTKALSEIASIIQSGDDDVIQISYAADQVSFTYKNNYVVSRLIQGQFPDFNQVIPKASKTKIKINKRQFLDASERCAIIASSSANIVKLEISDAKLLMTAKTPDVGDFSELVDIEIEGENSTHISFNIRLLIDVLKTLTDDMITLNVSGTLSPGLIKPVENENYLYVIMPIRTTDNK